MSNKRVDINDLLAQDQLEIVVGNKTYTIKDIPLNVYLESAKIAEDAIAEKDASVIHKQLARLFDVDVDELKDVGFRAAALCFREITNWVQGYVEETGGGGPSGSNPSQ